MSTRAPFQVGDTVTSSVPAPGKYGFVDRHTIGDGVHGRPLPQVRGEVGLPRRAGAGDIHGLLMQTTGRIRWRGAGRERSTRGNICTPSPRWATRPTAEPGAAEPGALGPSTVLTRDTTFWRTDHDASRATCPGRQALCSGGLTVQDVTKSGSATTSPLGRRRYSPALAGSNASGTGGSVNGLTCAAVDRHERVNRCHDPSELDALLGVTPCDRLPQ